MARALLLVAVTMSTEPSTISPGELAGVTGGTSDPFNQLDAALKSIQSSLSTLNQINNQNGNGNWMQLLPLVLLLRDMQPNQGFFVGGPFGGYPGGGCGGYPGYGYYGHHNFW